MSEHLVMECPLCGKQRLCPPSEMTADKKINVIGAHLFEYHPSVTPRRSEEVISEAVENMHIKSVEESAVEMKRWGDFDI